MVKKTVVFEFVVLLLFAILSSGDRMHVQTFAGSLAALQIVVFCQPLPFRKRTLIGILLSATAWTLVQQVAFGQGPDFLAPSLLHAFAVVTVAAVTVLPLLVGMGLALPLQAAWRSRWLDEILAGLGY